MDIKKILFLITVFVTITKSEKTELKIVNELSNYGFNAFAGGPQTAKLVGKVKPFKVSGPPHLKKLDRKCFNLTKDIYRYRFCPFNNVTQHEETSRWNPYNGILGIWSGWNIDFNTFTSMAYEKGEDCGSTERKVEVKFTCGRRNNLTDVSEPFTCSYVMLFQTPLVCHEDAMLVYPRMDEKLRKSWDDLGQEFYNGLITEKGYNVSLSKLYFEAGFTSKLPFKLDPDNKETTLTEFKDLATCNREYAKLLKEVDKYKNKEL